jgi:hypothetical protein
VQIVFVLKQGQIFSKEATLLTLSLMPACMQLVSINTTSRALEVHTWSIVPLEAGGELTGTYTLTIGAKESRPLQANASAWQVTAALRELLSDQSGTIGDELDGAGNTFDCFQGKGLQYRGLHNTAEGLPCLEWEQTDMWYPWQALKSGLKSNYCRNPNEDDRCVCIRV